MYLDTSYIAKFYVNEPQSPQVRDLVRQSRAMHSSVWALAEFHAVIHRHLREGSLSPADSQDLIHHFAHHVEEGLWNLIPVTESLLRRASALIIAAPRDLFIRTADAVHLVTAKEAGEREVWTNDRHMLAAASYFGLTGRSV